MRVLLVTSNIALQRQLQRWLARHHFVVDTAPDGEQALSQLQVFIYDVVVAERQLPKLDGLGLCHRLRDAGNLVLILLLFEAAAANACCQGLEQGADACLVQPIQEAELLVHLQTLARRGLRQANPKLTWGPLWLDPTAHRVTCQGQEVKLNRKEYQLLELLLRHPQQMFARSEIGDRLWTLDHKLPSDATIKSHIRSLRRKLERAGGPEDLLQTHYGQGYRLNPAYAPSNQRSKGKPSLSADMIDSVTANFWREMMAANARLQQEIEQRKQVEAQLRRSETMLRNAQRVAQIGCWEFDVHTRETYWTPELYLIHGVDPSGPPPTAAEVLALIHPEDRQLHEEAIRVPVRRGEPFEANLRIVRADDREVRYVNARGGPLFAADGKLEKFVGTTFDVTRWVQAGNFPPEDD